MDDVHAPEKEKPLDRSGNAETGDASASRQDETKTRRR